MGGVSDTIRDEIIAKLGMPLGQLLFRYWGVPLSSKKLTYNVCRPLLEKISGRIFHWTSRLLTYAGRLALIQSIVSSLYTLWGQIFILPKKVVKEIDQRCRSFLWSGKEGITRKAVVAWEKVCQPKIQGGLNLRQILVWNKVALLK